MKYMFASDVHGSAYYCRKMLNAYKEEKADRLVLLGDLLYHGPRNDLPKEYAPKEVIPMLNDMKKEIYAVRGNCEAEVDQMVLQFPVMADYCILNLDGRTFYATHGHVYNENNLPPLQEGDILESRFAVRRRDRTIHKRMREYLYTLAHDEDLVCTVLPVGDGLAVCTVKRKDG